MKAQFLPAISTATTGYLAKHSDQSFMEYSPENIVKSFRFFNRSSDTYFYHPYVLISAAHLFKHCEDVREHLGMDKETMVFIDSGGYSLASGAIKEKDWDDEKAFNWSMKNGNIFPILDRPLIPKCDYNRHLDLSFKSAEYYATNRPSKDFKVILNVVQGRTKQEMSKWIDKMSQVPLNGWAHGGHKGHMSSIVSVILELVNRGLMEHSSLHHVFGVSSASSMVYFAVIQDELQKMGFKTQLTYDSSYFQRSFAFGNYFLYKKFDGMVNIRLSNRYDWTHVPKGTKVPCDCPLCSNVKDVPNFFNDPMVFYMIGAMHNLYQMLSYKRSIENLLHFGEVQPGKDKKTGEVYDVEPFLKTALPTKMWQNICAIKKAFASPKSGYEIMKREFNDKDVAKSKRTLNHLLG